MQHKVMLVTVGGSSEPIVTSILDNKPDHVFFICSNDSAKTVNGPGKPCDEVKKCEICGARKGKMSESIVARTGLAESSYTIKRIDQLDDINDCYLLARELIRAVRADMPTAEIVIDYTGGTKSMSAGLVSAAMDDGNVRICIVKGRRDNIHVVKDGTQAARIIDDSKILVEKRLQSLTSLSNQYYYQSCLELLREMAGRPLPSQIHDFLEQLRYLCQGFETWDRFDYQSALEFLKPYKDQLVNHIRFLREICCVNELWSSAPAKLQQKSKKERVRLFSFAPVYDLLLNAERRSLQGRYDDAVARLYRALEMFGQINLFRWDSPLNTGDLDINLLPVGLRHDFESRRDPVTRKVTVSLMQNYLLLGQLGSKVGAIFISYRDRLKKELGKRNYSLLAHGVTPLGKSDYEGMNQVVESFLTECCTALGEKYVQKKELQFPVNLIEIIHGFLVAGADQLKGIGE